MNKFLKISGIVLAVIILTAFLFMLWTYIRIQRGDLVKWDNEWYAKKELKEKEINPAAPKHDSLIKKDDKQVENYSKAIVDYVIDGDTIVLTSGEKVRYIGIDTPELGKPGPQDDECLAWVARIRNLQLLETGELRLVKDSGADKDKYGRMLRYVYSGDIFINERLALEGLAETFFCKPGWKNCPVMYDEARKDSIQFAYNSAEQNRRGLFSGICDEKIIKETDGKVGKSHEDYFFNSQIFNNFSHQSTIAYSAPSTVDAINNWRESNAGPYNLELNPEGSDYSSVSDNVLFDPWISKEN